MGTSPLFIAAPVNFNGKAFGSFGVVATPPTSSWR